LKAYLINFLTANFKVVLCFLTLLKVTSATTKIITLLSFVDYEGGKEVNGESEI